MGGEQSAEVLAQVKHDSLTKKGVEVRLSTISYPTFAFSPGRSATHI